MPQSQEYIGQHRPQDSNGPWKANVLADCVGCAAAELPEMFEHHGEVYDEAGGL